MAQDDRSGALRRQALTRCAILDTPREPAFDSIVFTAAQLFRAPMAMLAMVDIDSVWLKAHVGPLPQRFPARSAFCPYVLGTNALLVVEDAAADKRFMALDLVTGPPRIRFYAGAPLLGPGQTPVAVLAILDSKPRNVPDHQERQLRQLAKEAERLLNARDTHP